MYTEASSHTTHLCRVGQPLRLGLLVFPCLTRPAWSALNNFSSPALLDLCGFENVNSSFRCSHLLKKKRKENLQIQNFWGDSVATAGQGHHGPRDLPSAPAVSSLPHHLPFSWLGSLPGNHISFITVAALQPSLANFPVACGVFQLFKWVLYFRLESPNPLEEFLLSLLCPYCPHSLKKEKKEDALEVRLSHWEHTVNVTPRLSGMLLRCYFET